MFVYLYSHVAVLISRSRRDEGGLAYAIDRKLHSALAATEGRIAFIEASSPQSFVVSSFSISLKVICCKRYIGGFYLAKTYITLLLLQRSLHLLKRKRKHKINFGEKKKDKK